MEKYIVLMGWNIWEKNARFVQQEKIIFSTDHARAVGLSHVNM